MATTVFYHAEHNGPARPAVNVKLYTHGQALWPDEFGRAAVSDDTSRYGSPWTDYIDAAYERVQSDFWQAAQEIATQRGLGEIEQEGRGGGWLVFTGLDPTIGGLEDVGEYDAWWLDAYAAVESWADSWIADAPRKVRELAQSLAMDEAGERAALRMFATFRAVSA